MATSRVYKPIDVHHRNSPSPIVPNLFEQSNTADPLDMDFLDLHPFVRSTAQDKAIGAIIGAALGDSIGLYTEFLPRTECLRTYPSVSDITGT